MLRIYGSSKRMTGLFLRGEVCDNSAEGGDDDDDDDERDDINGECDDDDDGGWGGTDDHRGRFNLLGLRLWMKSDTFLFHAHAPQGNASEQLLSHFTPGVLTWAPGRPFQMSPASRSARSFHSTMILRWLLT